MTDSSTSFGQSRTPIAPRITSEIAAEGQSSPDVADILIVGAGASGAAVAWRLAQAGFSVVCLEQGSWINPSAYPTTEHNWEILGRHEWNWDPNKRGNPEDYPVNDTDSAISPLMFAAVGGSTVHWTAHAPRFHPSDFRVKTLDGVAEDWPIDYQTLEPFYAENEIGRASCRERV